MKKPKISAEVSREEFEAYKAEAGRLGMNLSEWLRRCLNSSVMAGQKPAPAVAEAAFQQLEAQDALGGGVVAPQPVMVETKPLNLQGLPRPVALHPCVYLNPERPGNLLGGECSGTCSSASQRGKPCFFGPVTAHNCPLYASRVVPSAPVNGARIRR